MHEQLLPARYFAARRPVGDPLRGRAWRQVTTVPMPDPRVLPAMGLLGAVTRFARDVVVAARLGRASTRWWPERAS